MTDIRINVRDLLVAQWDGVGVGFTPTFHTDTYDYRDETPTIVIVPEQTLHRLDWLTNDPEEPKRRMRSTVGLLAVTHGDQVSRWKMLEELKRIIHLNCVNQAWGNLEVTGMSDEDVPISPRILQTRVLVGVAHKYP